MANESDPRLPVSDLPLAFELNNEDMMPVTQGTEGHYIARNATISLISDYIAKDKTYSDLTTTNKKLIAAINEAATSGTEILCGTSAPTSSQGENHNLYIQYTIGVGGASDVVDALFVKLDGAWCAIDVGGGAESLDDLTDTDITSGTLGSNQVLLYDGGSSKWINHDISISGDSGTLSDVSATNPSNSDVLMWSSDYDTWSNQPILIGNSSDEGNIGDVTVDNNTLSNKDVLIYDYSNSRWQNGVLFRDLYGTLSIGSTSVVITNTHSDITVSNASLEVFTDTFGVNPTDITVSGNNISLTFEAQSSTVNVKVRLWK